MRSLGWCCCCWPWSGRSSWRPASWSAGGRRCWPPPWPGCSPPCGSSSPWSSGSAITTNQPGWFPTRRPRVEGPRRRSSAPRMCQPRQPPWTEPASCPSAQRRVAGENSHMSFYVDLHLHSRYARATSRNADLVELAWWARRKGITVLGTGDFTHPVWFEELKERLVPAEPGLFRLRDELDRAVVERLPPSSHGPLRFLLAVEVSTAFHRDGRARRMHHLLYVPGLKAAATLRDRLGRSGNLTEDGRPTLAMDASDLLEATLDSGDGAYLVPAHLWTPWVGVLSATTGFDSIEACYGDLARHVFAVEARLAGAPADELAGLAPRPVPGGQLLGRARSVEARPRGDRARHRAGLLRDPPCAGDRGGVPGDGRALPRGGPVPPERAPGLRCPSGAGRGTA